LQCGCPLAVEPFNVTTNGPSMTVSYNFSVAMDGVRIITAVNGDSEDDPVSWVIEKDTWEYGTPEPPGDMQDMIEDHHHDHQHDPQSMEDGPDSRWEQVLSSHSTYWSQGYHIVSHIHFTPKARFFEFQIPLTRGTSIEWDARKPLWPLMVYAYKPLFAGCGLSLILGAAVAGKHRWAGVISSLTCLVSSLWSLSASISLFCHERGDDTLYGLYHLLHACILLAFSFQQAFFEYLFMPMLICVGILACVVDGVFNLFLFDSDHCRSTGCDLPVTSLALVISGVVVLFLKFFGDWHSKKMIQNDRKEYDRLWEQIHQDEALDLTRLSDMVQSMDNLNEAHARQFNRNADASLTWEMPDPAELHSIDECNPVRTIIQRSSTRSLTSEIEEWGIVDKSASTDATISDTGRMFLGSSNSNLPIPISPSAKRTSSSATLDISAMGAAFKSIFASKPRRNSKTKDETCRVDFSSKVTSLDQLCAQATGLDPILRSKVKEWAFGSQGLFRYVHPDGNQDFILWQDAVDHPEKIEGIRFAKMKTVRRAVEKLMRSYREDVSRLLDVCRQCIVFESVKDLTSCLRLIHDDPEVEIVRIKNRLDPSYNSTESAGYRDVALNLRICNQQSAHMALDTHVCEVQLLLKQIAEIKKDSGHKRYIQFRNARGM